MLHLQASSADFEGAESPASKVGMESQYFIISGVSRWGGRITVLRTELLHPGLCVVQFYGLISAASSA